MFILGKLAWALVQPGNLLLLCLLLGCLLGLKRVRGARLLIGVAALGFLVFAVVPVGALLLGPLEARFPRPAHLPDQIAGILVLGGGVDPRRSMEAGETVFSGSGSRLVAGVALARRHPEARLALLGGEGALLPSGLPEAEASLGYALWEGIARSRIVLDDTSRSTHENAVRGKALLKPRRGEAWLLVTSAWHMPRAVAAFQGVGWAVVPYPVDYRGGGFGLGFSLADGLDASTLAVKEWLGLGYYRLLGWTRPRPAAAQSHNAL